MADTDGVVLLQKLRSALVKEGQPGVQKAAGMLCLGYIHAAIGGSGGRVGVALRVFRVFDFGK